jgi:signal transduction histidine kinase
MLSPETRCPAPRTPTIVTPPRYRTRLFLILLSFAVVPTLALTLVWGGAVSRALGLVREGDRWEQVGASGERAIAAARSGRLTPEGRAAVDQHEATLRASLEQARRFQFLVPRTVRVVIAASVLGLALVALVASRVAGHLSRQLSRPVDELVAWAELLARGAPLPDSGPRRGAPEFEVLRERMRRTAQELTESRARALEGERLKAFRESARQVAHELKNPLTPIRFALARLRREAPPELHEATEVLMVETERLDRVARSFAQFGRLPEGPVAEVDVGELARYTARSTVPPTVALTLDVGADLPMVRGHHDALARALSNVLLNAVDACGDNGTARAASVGVRVARTRAANGDDAVEIVVRDSGCGIPAAELERMWEPYVTHKAGGTGLGLAIARQAVAAHAGSVSATSEVGRGTEIRFVLPVGADVAAANGRAT